MSAKSPPRSSSLLLISKNRRRDFSKLHERPTCISETRTRFNSIDLPTDVQSPRFFPVLRLPSFRFPFLHSNGHTSNFVSPLFFQGGVWRPPRPQLSAERRYCSGASRRARSTLGNRHPRSNRTRSNSRAEDNENFKLMQWVKEKKMPRRMSFNSIRRYYASLWCIKHRPTLR